MATFEAQVEGLTSLSIDGSSAPTQTELTQFLTEGAKDIINQMPRNLLPLCASEQSFTSGTPQTLNTGKILYVTRSDGTIAQPCRKIQGQLVGRSLDSGDMNAATVTDPIYYVKNNTIDVAPSSGSSVYSEVQYPTVAYGDSAISAFPDEAEYLVPLYASVKSLQNVLGNKSSNSDITTALTAINTELDETQAVCDLINTQVDSAVSELGESATQVDSSVDTALAAIATAAGRVNTAVELANLEYDKCDTILDLGEADSEGDVNTALTAINAEIDECLSIADDMHTEVGLINAEVDLAKTEAAELASQTDNGGDIETALDAINTALDKFRADASDPALFGDETQYTTGTGITRVIAALTAANDVINNNQPSATTDAYGALANEDTELVSSSLQVAQVEISKAKVYLEEFNATVRALQTEAQGFASEVNARVSFSGAKSQAIQGYINTANGYAVTARGYGDEMQRKLEIANTYSKEVQSRLQQAQAKREESRSRVEVGNAYLAEANASANEAQTYANEVSARISQVSGYGQVVSGYISAAQGYASEIQSKIQIAQGYGNEAQLRLSVDSAQYGWLEKQQAKLQADYDKGLQALR